MDGASPRAREAGDGHRGARRDWTADILMITYDRPAYVRRSLPRLLDTCDERMRVWLWHNGDDAGTLGVTRSLAAHPRVHAFHHSRRNRGLREPTNWLWAHATGDFVSKVDDDCLVADGWAPTLAAAHLDYERFGVLASWRFYDEDLVPELAARKIFPYPGGHRVLRNLWVQGSGYLMKRRCVEDHGPLRPGQSFTQYCIDLAAAGRVNGWYHPFVHEEHMDDPRSPYTELRSDEDLRRRLPLTAAARGITTLAGWEARMRESARELQAAPLDVRHYRGWRARARRLAQRAARSARSARSAGAARLVRSRRPSFP